MYRNILLRSYVDPEYVLALFLLFSLTTIPQLLVVYFSAHERGTVALALSLSPSLSLSFSLSSVLFSRFFRLDHSATRSEDRFRPCKVRAFVALLVREITAARNNDDDNVNCLSSRAHSVTTARGHMSRERTNDRTVRFASRRVESTLYVSIERTIGKSRWREFVGENTRKENVCLCKRNRIGHAVI